MENRNVLSMKKIVSQFTNPVLFIGIAVMLRLIPHLPNMSPIAAMALFGGVYVNKKYALLVPLLAMAISDMFLGFSWVTPFVYGSFLLIGMIGLWLRGHQSPLYIVLASLVGSTIFFLITNFGVWVVGGLYPHTLQGLQDCFVLALPFFRNTILGDLLYVGVLFGSFVFARTLLKQKVAIV